MRGCHLTHKLNHIIECAAYFGIKIEDFFDHFCDFDDINYAYKVQIVIILLTCVSAWEYKGYFSHVKRQQDSCELRTEAL